MSTPLRFAPDGSGSAARRRIPRWVGVVFPVVGLGAAAMLAVSASNRVWLPFVPSLAGAAALGLLSGFTVRWTMRDRPPAFRWAAALGAVTVGLLGAGLASGGDIGIGPLLPSSGSIRWFEAAHLAAGAVAAWLALRAFPGTRSQAPPAAVREPPPTPWTLADPRLVEDTRPTTPRRRQPQPAPSTPAPGRVPVAPPAGRSLRERYRQARLRLAQLFAWRRPGRPPSRQLPPIRFTGGTEDRCPYCLDRIDPHDSRGVTRCPVCHTPHHVDCWAITGMCQMPHLYQPGSPARPGASR